MMFRHSPLAPLLLIALTQGCGEDQDPVASADDASASAGDASAPNSDGGAPPFDAAPPVIADAGVGCRTFVSDSLIQHACFHEIMGPYAERMAGSSAAQSGIDVDRAHTSFRVRLPARAEGGYGGFLSYKPRSSGAHAIFAKGATVRVSVPGGAALTPTFAHDTQICAELPAVSVFTLDGPMYTLEVTGAVPDVVLVIEYMDEGTVADAYRMECTGGPRTARDAAVFTLDAGADAASGSWDGAVPPKDDASSPAMSDGAVSGAGDGAASGSSDASTDAASDKDDAGADAGMCTVDPVLEHSCLHALHGPFEAVSGAPGTPGPDVSRVHTAWRVTLPAASRGSFTFRPTSMGEYVFYLDRPLPLEVQSAGVAIAPAYSESVLVGCAGISEARVFPLTRGARYDVFVGPTAGDTAMLIIESVQAFTSSWSERVAPCP